jgi:EpsI family protein
VTVNRYMLANGQNQALVYYWYQGRGRVAHSEYRVKWDLLRDAMRHGRTEEALVRIVVPIPKGPGSSASSWNERVGRAEAVAREVAADLIPRVETALPTWMRGSPRA